jgi:hypothetical protein
MYFSPTKLFSTWHEHWIFRNVTYQWFAWNIYGKRNISVIKHCNEPFNRLSTLSLRTKWITSFHRVYSKEDNLGFYLNLLSWHAIQGITDNKTLYKQNLKVCDDGTLIQILCFWTLSIVLFFFKTPSCFYLKTQHFGDWILSQSSDKTYSVGPNRQS